MTRKQVACPACKRTSGISIHLEVEAGFQIPIEEGYPKLPGELCRVTVPAGAQLIASYMDGAGPSRLVLYSDGLSCMLDCPNCGQAFRLDQEALDLLCSAIG